MRGRRREKQAAGQRGGEPPCLQGNFLIITARVLAANLLADGLNMLVPCGSGSRRHSYDMIPPKCGYRSWADQLGIRDVLNGMFSGLESHARDAMPSDLSGQIGTYSASDEAPIDPRNINGCSGGLS